MARCTVYVCKGVHVAGDADDDEDITVLFDPDQPALERYMTRVTLNDTVVQVRAALQLYAATPAPTP